MLGLGLEDFYDMTVKEFFSSLNGRFEHEKDLYEVNRRLLFEAVRFNASGVAGSMSREQAEAISKHRFDWEKGYTGNSREPISYDSFKRVLDGISREEK